MNANGPTLGDVSPKALLLAAAASSSDFVDQWEAHWPQKDRAPDYAHLTQWPGVTSNYDANSFMLTHDVLRTLAASNSFLVDRERDTFVLFGLRGCRLTGQAPSDFVRSIELAPTSPSHQRFQCVIGVWQPRDETVMAFPGSTVPAAFYVRDQAKAISLLKSNAICEGHYLGICNLLPTGYYIYTPGLHNAVHAPWTTGCDFVRGLKGDALRVPSIKGAFVRDSRMTVLRTSNDLSYETNDVWHLCAPGDNIHAARTDKMNAIGACEAFSSAGCQVVDGDYIEDPGGGAGAHTGHWATFRRAAGWRPSGPAQSEYRYILVTGDEAAFAARRPRDLERSEFRRYRHGSEDFALRSLQRALRAAGATDGNQPLGIDRGIMGGGATFALSQSGRDYMCERGLMVSGTTLADLVRRFPER